jgi:cobalt-zinc-cadmium efflux system protein
MFMSVPDSRVGHHNDHNHDHDHGHDHHHGLEAGTSPGGKQGLLIALTITVLMMVVEIAGGLISNSLALLSDAGHMFTDNLALLLSFFAIKFASMPATERKTFGFYRLEILAAFVNGVVLVLMSFYLMYEAYQRILHPQPVAGILMLVVAAVGLAANIIGAFVLNRHSHASLNIRGAYLHILGDALSSVGVVIGGVIILKTGWYLVDPLLSVLISFVIIYSAWTLVREAVNVLLESVPAHINIAALTEEIEKIEGVREAYHIHVWTITSGVYAMSGHVLIDDQMVSRNRDLIDRISEVLARKYKVMHSTIQIECERCELSPVCALPSANRQSH